MMCGHAKETMAAYWQREITSDEESTLQQHLESCTECSAEMAALGRLWERLADMPAPEPSQALHARWQSTLETLMAANKPVSRAWRLASFWPTSPVWQAAIALACMLIGIFLGTNLPRRNNEIAKLHEEIANTREMVALSLLQQQSATERLRGVDYTGRMKTMEPEVVSALTEAVAHDASVNVRLAALDALGNIALSKASGSPGVLQSLTQSLPRQDSPMVQAALIDYLVEARDRKAVGALRQLAALPDLNPAVLERTHFALQQLSH
jgi:hypothetical protein